MNIPKFLVVKGDEENCPIPTEETGTLLERLFELEKATTPFAVVLQADEIPAVASLPKGNLEAAQLIDGKVIQQLPGKSLIMRSYDIIAPEVAEGLMIDWRHAEMSAAQSNKSHLEKAIESMNKDDEEETPEVLT